MDRKLASQILNLNSQIKKSTSFRTRLFLKEKLNELILEFFKEYAIALAKETLLKEDKAV